MVTLQQRRRKYPIRLLPIIVLYGWTILLLLAATFTRKTLLLTGDAWYCFGYSDISSSNNNGWGVVDGFAINPSFTTLSSSSSNSDDSNLLLKTSSSSSLSSTTTDSSTSSADVTNKDNASRQSDVPIIISNKIKKRTWMYQEKYPIAYESLRVSRNNINSIDGDDQDDDQQEKNENTTPILFLNGFGMGSFHQHRLMKSFAKQCYKNNSENDEQQSSTSTTDYMLYGIDYIGQGFSWPINCNDDGTSETEIGLQYSGNQWVQQIIQFIEECVLDHREPNGENDNIDLKQRRKVHIVGNSLGGHLAVYIAAKRPDLIDSIILLNPTPLWGMNLPGWDGVLPPPTVPRIIGRYLYDLVRNPLIIRAFLQATYVHQSSWDGNSDRNTDTTNEVDKLSFTEKITKSTSGFGGHVAFASILWSRAVSIECNTDAEGKRKQSITVNNFYECLQHVQCNALLCFGTQDPWCKPIFAKRMCNELSARQQHANGVPSATHTYIEIDNVGHCPNHEAPNTVAYILHKWFDHWNQQQNTNTIDPKEPNGETKEYSPLLFDKSISINEEWGDAFIIEKSPDDISLSLLDQIMVKYI